MFVFGKSLFKTYWQTSYPGGMMQADAFVSIVRRAAGLEQRLIHALRFGKYSPLLGRSDLCEAGSSG